MITRKQAREYFSERNLSYKDINRKKLKRLRTLIKEQIGMLNIAKRNDLNLNLTPFETKSFDKLGQLEFCYMYLDGEYFQRREAISFNKVDEDGKFFIGFGGWASDDNIQPALNAFCLWVDELYATKDDGSIPFPVIKNKVNISRLSKAQKSFSVGYFCACANMMFDHDQPTMVEDCLRANFMSIAKMRSIGVQERDIELLAPVIKEIERKRKL